eukprot:581282-Amorphochlora_amoeboformis.AAC.1
MECHTGMSRWLVKVECHGGLSRRNVERHSGVSNCGPTISRRMSLWDVTTESHGGTTWDVTVCHVLCVTWEQSHGGERRIDEHGGGHCMSL